MFPSQSDSGRRHTMHGCKGEDESQAALLLHLSGRVTVLLNIHFVGSTLHGEPIHLLELTLFHQRVPCFASWLCLAWVQGSRPPASRSLRMSRLCSPSPPCTPLMRRSKAPRRREASALRSSASKVWAHEWARSKDALVPRPACCSTAPIFSKASCLSRAELHASHAMLRLASRT